TSTASTGPWSAYSIVLISGVARLPVRSVHVVPASVVSHTPVGPATNACCQSVGSSVMSATFAPGNAVGVTTRGPPGALRTYTWPVLSPTYRTSALSALLRRPPATIDVTRLFVGIATGTGVHTNAAAFAASPA